MSKPTTGAGLAHIERPHEGETNDWWTPPSLVQSLGEFDLDPCAGVGQEPLARCVYVLPQDGLSLPWSGRVWCNPPYGDNVIDWAERMIEHGSGTLLIYARVETLAWRRIWETANGVMFLTGRIKFLRGDSKGKKATQATAPSTLVAYGKNDVDALLGSGLRGAMVLDWVCL